MNQSGSSRLCWRQGAVILREGDVGDDFFIVDSGRVTISIHGRGTVAEAGPGEFFGELALMYDAPRAATVVRSHPCARTV